MRGGKVLFSTPEQVLRRYDELGIETGCLLPLIGPEMYIPESNEEILAMAARWPDRFVPFCNIDPRAIANSADAPLGDILRYYRDLGCKGIGEVMPNLSFSDPLVRNLFAHVQDVGLPLIFDGSVEIGKGYGLVDDPGMPRFEQCLWDFPNLTFLGHGPPFWAEIGRLEKPDDRAGYPRYPIQAEGVVPRLFREHPNLWGDLSASSGFNALARDREYAVKFLGEFQDRLCFGTDICSPDQELPLTALMIELKDGGGIGKDIFNKIMSGNAARLLGRN